MSAHRRREFLKRSLATAGGWSLLPAGGSAEETERGDLKLARFRFDVTPPVGHSLCGGWIKPVEAVDDSLEAIGFVLLGAGEPIVVCAVDWTGILNDAHVRWREVLAKAAGTRPDRVAVQCVHQHNAPFACLEAERLVRAHDLPHIVERPFFDGVLDRAGEAVRAAIAAARSVTHVATGESGVDRVASNRRVSRDAAGRVVAMRGSSCRDEALRALPEGLVDPMLKTVVFFDGEEKLAACHYYATHPMSYYGDGRVTSDFVGLARKALQREQPDCLQIYFTGCAGDVAAGKYNDGSREARSALTERILDAMKNSEAKLEKQSVKKVAWRSMGLLPPARSHLQEEELLRRVADTTKRGAHRSRPAFMLSWLRRVAKRTPIVLSALHINDVAVLHLPAECFVKYQLRAQQLRPNRFVATAAYGDGGPWYLPVEDEYPAGGYEVSVAFCEPEVDQLLTRGIAVLLG